jgi:Txe/YoeB family toxin of Txe-Axe toxin-antitoxin module
MELAATERFRDSLRRFRDPNRVKARIQHIVRAMESDPKNWLRDFERIHTHASMVYREKISKGSRLLFQVGEKLTFLDYDAHEIYRDWERNLSGSNVEQMISGASVLRLDDYTLFPTNRTLSPFTVAPRFRSDNSDITVMAEAEWDESWLLFLTPRQMRYVLQLEELITKEKEFQVHWVWGGAGTGKTVIALHLLQRLMSAVPGLSFDTPNRARKYIEMGNKELAKIPNSPQVDGVHIIDDPTDYNYVAQSIKLAKRALVRSVIVFMDPLQAQDERDAARFYVYSDKESKGEMIILHECFRQAENVGRPIRDLVIQAFGYEEKDVEDVNKGAEGFGFIEPRLVDMLAVRVHFEREGGIFDVVEGDLSQSIQSVAGRIKNRYDLWDWTQPVLLVWDDALYDIRKTYRGYFEGISKLEIKYSDAIEVRGVEYQEVVLIMLKTGYEELMEVSSNPNDFRWHKHSPLYVLLSRAKDAVSLILV